MIKHPFDFCHCGTVGWTPGSTKRRPVWSLYQQTEPAHNWQIRAVLESIADELLDDFFAYYLPDQHLDFYTDAVRVLQRTRMDLSSRGYGGYASLNTLGTWPVIPQALVGKLTEHHLRPVIWGR